MYMYSWEDLNTSRYYGYVEDLKLKYGQWSEEIRSSERGCEIHHILLRCMGGEPKDKRGKHAYYENLTWVYPRDHFILHKILAEDNPNCYNVVYAFHMMATMSKNYKRKIDITPEEYEEAKILWKPFNKITASSSSVGRRWYNDGTRSYFLLDNDKGYEEGRCKKDILNIGLSSIGRKIGSGKHLYNNGIIQKCYHDGEQPVGWSKGGLPMPDKGKEAHRIAAIGKNRGLPINMGYETLSSVKNRIDENLFREDYLNNLSEQEMCNKYNLTKCMFSKYRQSIKLLMDSRGNRYYEKK